MYTWLLKYNNQISKERIELEQLRSQIKESSPAPSVFNSSTTPKKNLFQIEPVQTPFKSNSDKKSKNCNQFQISQLNFLTTLNKKDTKPKFSLIQNEIINPPIQNLPSFKFVANTDPNSLNKIELNQIQETKNEIINNDHKKNKDIKLKKRKFKKFKIYHIEFKKLSEKDKILNKQRHKRKYKQDDIRKKIKARFHK